jgi:hypothetical protein
MKKTMDLKRKRSGKEQAKIEKVRSEKEFNERE